MSEPRLADLGFHTGVRRVWYVLKWIAILTVTFFSLIVAILVTFLDRGGRVTHRLARTWAHLLLRISGVRLRFSGYENLPRDGSFVFVCNHHSAVDIPVLIAALPLRFRMLAKASLFRIPLFGWYLTRAGYVPVQRNLGASMRQLLADAAGQVGAGASILVFAQGTRTPEGVIGPFKRGSSYLARFHGLPLVPIGLVNTGRILPPRSLRIDPGVVEVRIGHPLEDDGTLSHQELAVRLREAVIQITSG